MKKATPASANVEQAVVEALPSELPKSAKLPDPLAIPPPEADFAPPPGLTEGLQPESSRKTIFAKEIAAIAEKGGVAPIAKHFVRDGIDEIEATRIALRLLEAEQYVLADLRGSGDIQSGLAKCREAWDLIKRHEKAVPYTYKIDASGSRLPVPLEEGLRVLMQHDGKELRLPLFREWLCDDCIRVLRAVIQDLKKQQPYISTRIENVLRSEQKEFLKDPRKLFNKADSLIKRMQEHGIPVNLFDRARHDFKDWRTRRVREKRRASGALGAKKRKLRRAARPPFEQLKKMGHDWSEGKIE